MMDFYKLAGIKKSIVQAPMAGVQDWQLAVAVSESGGLGSIPCGMLSPDQVISEVVNFKKHSSKPFNLNFFCHDMPAVDAHVIKAWEEQFKADYDFYSVAPPKETSGLRVPFDDVIASRLEEIKPPVMSFHFGLPSPNLVKKIKSWGTVILSSATTKEEGIWLQSHGADVVIAQGKEAGGHRAMFLTTDPSTQVATTELVSSLKSVLSIPIIAAGGIDSSSRVTEMLELGASGVQVGTSYLLCHEAKTSELHREALKSQETKTALTNVFSGRLARGIVNKVMVDRGFITPLAPAFPYASIAIAPLRSKAESFNRPDFSPLWSGTNRSGCREVSAAQLTNELWKGN